VARSSSTTIDRFASLSLLAAMAAGHQDLISQPAMAVNARALGPEDQGLLGQAREHIVGDRARGFAPAVVGGQDGDVGFERSAAHRSALGAVTVAAASEDADQTPAGKFTAQCAQHDRDLFRSMRIVDDRSRVASARSSSRPGTASRLPIRDQRGSEGHASRVSEQGAGSGIPGVEAARQADRQWVVDAIVDQTPLATGAHQTGITPRHVRA
jgi:hypothetical protein